jgi:hypothetical protein
LEKLLINVTERKTDGNTMYMEWMKNMAEYGVAFKLKQFLRETLKRDEGAKETVRQKLC